MMPDAKITQIYEGTNQIQRPQFGDRFGSVTGLAGDFGQPDRGFAELKHGTVIAVGPVGDAENVRRDM
jgi:hypothetical protein